MIDENYWNESDLQIIEEHEKYHEGMLNYLNELKKYGPLNIEPKKPSSKLPILFRKAWVEENINISDRSVRKKIEIANLIGDLP